MNWDVFGHMLSNVAFEWLYFLNFWKHTISWRLWIQCDNSKIVNLGSTVTISPGHWGETFFEPTNNLQGVFILLLIMRWCSKKIPQDRYIHKHILPQNCWHYSQLRLDFMKFNEMSIQWFVSHEPHKILLKMTKKKVLQIKV